MRTLAAAAALTAALGISVPIWAAAPPEDKCEASKNQEAGKYAACLLKAEKKLILSGNTTKHADAVAKCDAKFSSKWAKAEQKAAKANSTCPSTNDEARLMAGIGAQAACLSTALSGGDDSCLTCGNGIVEGGEDCDLGAAIASDCATETGGAAPFGTLLCGAGCAYDTAGCIDCAAGGELVGGACWYAGAAGDDCGTTCGDLGLAYDDATRFFAGSDGSDRSCNSVLDALGFPSTALQNTGPGGDGCAYCATCSPPRVREITVPTSEGAGDPLLERVCACQ